MNPMKSCLPLNGLVRRAALWSVALLLLASSGLNLRAQSLPTPPERLTYQGFLADANGVALGNTGPKNYDVIFRIFDDPDAGRLLWAEQQTITVDQGYFGVMLGEGSSTGEPRPVLSSIFRGATASERYIAVTVRGLGNGGANVDILPRLRLLSSPYAFLAQNAVKLVQDTGADLLTSSGNTVTVNGPLNASSLAGNGANLTALNAGNVTAGTLADARLTANVPRLDAAAQTFGGSLTVNGNLSVNGTVGGYGTIPLGGIIMWSGATVPAGWAICDGNTVNGRVTPDLRGRFILGTGSGIGLTPRSLGQTGGEEQHTLTIAEMPAHTHNFRAFHANFGHSGGATEGSTRDDGDGAFMDGGAVQSAGGSQPHNNMPPFYALAFIMRVQ